jgi:hypothetical protein
MMDQQLWIIAALPYPVRELVKRGLHVCGSGEGFTVVILGVRLHCTYEH